MRSPELDKQAVQVLPLLGNPFCNRASECASSGLNGDSSKVLGFDGLERRDDPLHVWPPTSKYHVFEFRGGGEV